MDAGAGILRKRDDEMDVRLLVAARLASIQVFAVV
jgi:hypothetical protein